LVFENILVIDDEDEKTITQGALVTLVVNLKRHNLKVMFNNDETQKIKPIENGEDLDGGVDSSDLVVADGESNTEGNSTKVVTTAPANKPWKDSSKKKPKKPKQKPVKPKQTQKPVTTNTTTPVANTPSKSGNSKDDTTHSDDEHDDDKNSDYSSENDEDENKSDGVVENVGASSSTTTSQPKSQEDNDEYFEKFQQMQKKKEKLETKAKISHRVYCPFFPDVSRLFLY
jgi:hypothetical protein